MPVLIPQNKEEVEKIIGSSSFVVIDFSAKWCGPCNAVGPKFEKMSNDARFSDITFVKVDIDKLQEYATGCGITSIPTFHFLYKGQKVGSVIGANVAELEKQLLTFTSNAPNYRVSIRSQN